MRVSPLVVLGLALLVVSLHPVVVEVVSWVVPVSDADGPLIASALLAFGGLGCLVWAVVEDRVRRRRAEDRLDGSTAE